MLILLVIILSLVSLAILVISLALLFPLASALVRFRANYNPKGLQLDPEGDAQPYTGPVITSFFAMLKRVHGIEGWPGLYKGLMPSLMSSLIRITVFLIISLTDSNLRHGTYTALSAGVFGTLVYRIFAMFLSFPQTIIIDRAITTPHMLPWFDAAYSCRTLFTPTERRRPWILYLTPGLLAAQVTRITYVVLVPRSIRQLILPELTGNHVFSIWQDVSSVRLSIFFILSLASTAVLTPLKVISIRLAIQRNHASPEYNSVSQEDSSPEYSGADEDVIGLRTDRAPYIGLIDCGKRIIQEEGWSALYRAWWVTMLGCIFLDSGGGVRL